MSNAVQPGDTSRPRTEASQPGDGSPVLATEHHDLAERRELLRQQRDRFGGMKFGACFFGWLTAAGAAVLLGAVAAGIAGAAGGPGAAAPSMTDITGTTGLVGAIALAVVVFVAYLCGGYVAGRMARFSGLKQGLGVWLWALVIAVIAGIAGAVLGSRVNTSVALGGLPRLPFSAATLTTTAVIAVLVALAVALIGALLGGLLGMRFHRRVDRAAL